MKRNLLLLAKIAILFLSVSLLTGTLSAQRRKKKQLKTQEAPAFKMDENLFEGMTYRSIGPFRGGRSCAVTGVPGKSNLFYFGSTGGGVWRTQDGGQSWKNISDGYFGGSVGAVSVSEYDNNVIYVGGGEKTVRGNVSYGYGIWKTLDAGKTWQQMGLKDSRHISRIRIHPRDPNLVYAAVMGDLYKSSEERGVYRSKDGGENWERILFANADAGAVDLILDPSNPRHIYASTWRIRRTPYSLSSGGEGSDMWKSTDGGDSWEKISDNKGLPKGTRGIIGIAVSPVKKDRVWAIIEAEKGGVFRSDDGGENWIKTNDSRSLRQRAWYYTRIYADTEDGNTVYVMNVSYHKSTDGGRTFSPKRAPHGDHHDLWIAPEDPQRMIIGDDGGAQISFDGGENWSTYYNQPTSQFYRVTTDNHFPYRIYAAQQDNSTVRIAHRTLGRSIGEKDWESTAGGESAHIAVDPRDSDVVYGGSYGGYLTRIDHGSGDRRAINVWPDNPMGYGAEGMKYRFQWNFPIFFSPNDPKKLYAASNQLHVSTDEGQSWKTISPDLTRNDSAKLKSSGGPITQDNTGVEYYCTIFAAAESPMEEGLIWTGSDDGLIHIRKNEGAKWENVTPESMPEWIMVNSIDVDPFEKGGAYVAATMYKSGDYRPYLYKTKDYGKTWTKITKGIDEGHFTRVVRADPKQKGLLYAGTESGMYISFDDGANWQSFQLDLPIVPITDLTIKDDNLIVATQGRSLWIIDDLTLVHQLKSGIAEKDFHVFKPMPAYRMGGVSRRKPRGAGQNHPGGVMVHLFAKEKLSKDQKVSISFYEKDKTLIKTFTSKDKAAKKWFEELKPGVNRFLWDMRYEDAKNFKGMILWWGQTSGPKAIPGDYKLCFVVDKDSMWQDFTILPNPLSEASQSDLEQQFEFLLGVRDKLTETHEAIIDIRKTRGQFKGLKENYGKDKSAKELMSLVKQIDSAMTLVEKNLYQTKNRSGQDPLNYPIKLNNKLAHLGALESVGDHKPTAQSLQFRDEIVGKINAELEKWYDIRDNDIPKVNDKIKDLSLDYIRLKPEKEVE